MKFPDFPSSLPNVFRIFSAPSSRPVMQLFAIFAIIFIPAIALTRPAFHGDAAEYTLMTISIAQHGTVEVTKTDAGIAKKIFPAFAWHHDEILSYFDGRGRLPPGFLEGTDKKVHAVHFFGYSAIAVIPFKILQLGGLNPAKSFIWVDVLSLILLLYSAYLYFKSVQRAFLVLALFTSTVGYAYWNWASPELFSAALSLSALLLMTRSLYLPAGILLGLSGMQNPPLLSLLFIGPVFASIETASTPPFRNLRSILSKKELRGAATGALIGVVVGLSPIYFSLRFFDTWNVIATGATDPRLISVQRLISYYIDLNQGLLIAIPAVLLFIPFIILKTPRAWLILIPAAISSLILAIPALSTQNWNSGASGEMRYIAWGAVPFLVLFITSSRNFHHIPKYVIIFFFALQIPFAINAKNYPHTDFSPLAHWMLRHAPQMYNPEPEIFIDRVTHSEPLIDFDKVYSFGHGDKRKTLFYSGSMKSISALCPNSMPKARSTAIASYDGWTYLNGEIECDHSKLLTQKFDVNQFSQELGVRILDGWSRFEFGKADEGGIWSIGKQSSFVLSLPEGQPDAVTIFGTYMEGNYSTEVNINGQPAGVWHLDRPNRIKLPDVKSAKQILVTLKHASPKKPSERDTRDLAFFLKHVSISVVEGQ